MRSSPDPATRLVGPVGLGDLPAAWAAAEPWLLPALERDGWKVRPDHLLDFIRTGAMELWMCLDTATNEIIAALVTEGLEYPKARIFSLAYCGGRDVARWAPWIVALEDIAAQRGYTHVRIAGRRGWERIFPDYEERFRIFERPVDPPQQSAAVA